MAYCPSALDKVLSSIESLSTTTLEQVRDLVSDAEQLKDRYNRLSTENDNLNTKISKLPTVDSLNDCLAENASLRKELRSQQDVFTAVENQVKKLSLRNDELQASLVACNSEIITSTKEPANLRLTLDKAFEVLQERNMQLVDEVETLKTTLDVNDTLHKEGLRKSNALHIYELNVLCKSLEDSHKRQVDNSATQITDLRASLEEVTKRLQESTLSLDELTTKNALDASRFMEEEKRAAAKLEESRRQLNDSLTQNTGLTAAFDELTTKNTSDASKFMEEENRTTAKLEEFRRQLNDSLTQNTGLTAALEKATRRLEELTLSLDDTKRKNAQEKVEERNRAAATIEDLRRQLDDSTIRNTGLTASLEEVNKRLEELTVSLHAVKKNASDEKALIASQTVEERNQLTAKFEDGLQKARKVIEELMATTVTQKRTIDDQAVAAIQLSVQGVAQVNPSRERFIPETQTSSPTSSQSFPSYSTSFNTRLFRGASPEIPENSITSPLPRKRPSDSVDMGSVSRRRLTEVVDPNNACSKNFVQTRQITARIGNTTVTKVYKDPLSTAYDAEFMSRYRRLSTLPSKVSEI
jgi:chromosome segregation ATPase